MPEAPSDAPTLLVHESIPAVGRLGITVESLEPGATRLRLPIEGNGNHLGTMYAGALFALVELPGGLIPIAFFGPGQYVPIVTDLHIEFLAAARTDVTLSARMDVEELRALAAQADAEGQAPFTLALHGEDAAGRTVVASTAHYLLRRGRS